MEPFAMIVSVVTILSSPAAPNGKEPFVTIRPAVILATDCPAESQRYSRDMVKQLYAFDIKAKVSSTCATMTRDEVTSMGVALDVVRSK